MGQAIVVIRMDRTAAELCELAAKAGDGAQVRRLLAIALILDGRSRTEAAEQCGMDRQTLRAWVHRYKLGGDCRPGIAARPSAFWPRRCRLWPLAARAALKATTE